MPATSRLLQAMENHFCNLPFLLGRRPAAGDFAVYGQFTQLVGFDPTAADDRARDITALGGLGGSYGGPIPASNRPTTTGNRLSSCQRSLRGILSEVGRVYVPALLANAEAVAAGEKEWVTEIRRGRVASAILFLPG